MTVQVVFSQLLFIKLLIIYKAKRGMRVGSTNKLVGLSVRMGVNPMVPSFAVFGVFS